jgi:hypothetical protein
LEIVRNYDAFELKDGATLVWVVQTAGPHRIDTPFSLPADEREFTIADRLTLDIHDRWPIEVYLGERWYEPESGSRRLSNIVRINRDAVCQGIAPKATSANGGLMIRSPD